MTKESPSRKSSATARHLLAALACAIALSSAVRAQVVLNEIHYNPAGDDATVQLEFIELYNAGPTSVDLGAWKLLFGPDPLVFPLGTTLASHAYLVAAQKISSLAAATGYTAQFEWQGLNAGLGNGGDDITLEDASSAVVDFVTYDDAAPWPTAPDGNGPSLELINPALDNTLALSWRASTGANGTPGAQNSTFTNAPTIQSESPRRLSAVETLPSVSITFSKSVTGVIAGNLTVNGSAATSVAGTGIGPYVFSGFSAPAPGSATIALAAGAIQGDGVPFGGDSWTISVGLVVVFNEIHYHPASPNDDAEFLELYNTGTNTADLSSWTLSDGVTMTFPPGTLLAAGGYLVTALDSALLQTVTGYSGALQWSSGHLANSGERVALSDAQGNEIDVVSYSDGGDWSGAADGNGPSLELIHPRLPNEYGAAWKASVPANGTPGAVNSTFDPAPAPILFGTLNTPAIPSPSQSVTITASIIDEATVPTATLYYRLDQDPTIAYASTPMLDDGLHGDGAAGDRVYGAVVAGLLDGQRLDFTIRASDGTKISAAPPGNDTLNPGEFPSQTYLCEFLGTLPPSDFPVYHMLMTAHARALQGAVDDYTDYDATFLQCGAATCQIFYNVLERYRGHSSLTQHPHSYNIDFASDRPLASEMGFDISNLDLMAQGVDKQKLGYQMFREAFGGSIPTPLTQFVRFHTNPLSQGGTQDYIYVNVEDLKGDFLRSEHGQIIPERFPDRCSGSGATCGQDADCPTGQICVSTSSGDLYRGVSTGDLQYLGTDPDPYRPSYKKETNTEADDWSKLVDECYVLDTDTTSDANFETSVNASGDELEWARWYAIHMLLVNQETGIYRDTGDDYYIYFEPDGSPDGRNTKFLTWDQDSVYGGFGNDFRQETIWRTTTPTAQRFVRNNAYAGRFVGAICDLLQTDFTESVQDARIDEIPDTVSDASRKQQFRDWVTARIASVNAEIVRSFTLTGVPASPYSGSSAVIPISGQLDQCGTYRILVNGTPATYSVFSATWSASVTLLPGTNQILVQDLDVNGVELHRQEATVVYRPPVTVSFQNAASYTGTQDTWLGDDLPSVPNGNRDHIRWDVNSPAQEYALIRFDSIFGSGPGQIPSNANITAASLTINIFNISTGLPGELHESAVDWSEATATWNNFGGEPGVQSDEIGVFVAPAPLSGVASIDVKASLQRWLTNPSSNFGWILVPISPDEARAYSSEATVIANRPKLTVSYVPPCVADSDCNDGLYCNGTEICSAGSCVSASVPACDDGIGCTADSCNEATDTCTHAGNDALCDDGVICNGAETCGPTGCQAGTPAPLPSEVAGFQTVGALVTTLSWTLQASGIHYDLATGLISTMSATQGISGATCLANDVTTSSYVDGQAIPAPGTGYFYVVRAQNQCGTGTYGYASSGAERLPVAACP